MPLRRAALPQQFHFPARRLASRRSWSSGLRARLRRARDHRRMLGRRRRARARRRRKKIGQPLKLIIGAEFRLECGLRFVALAPDRRATAGCAGSSRGAGARRRRAATRSSAPMSRALLSATASMLWLPGAQPRCRCRALAQGAFRRDVWIAVELLLRRHDDRERLAALDAARARRSICRSSQAATCTCTCASAARCRMRSPPSASTCRSPKRAERLYPNGERHLREPQRLARLYPPQLLAETLAIAERCTFSLDELRYEYPRELVPAGETPRSSSAQAHGSRARAGAGRKACRRDARHDRGRARAHRASCATSLISSPCTTSSRTRASRNILCQGRGSAANSVVCYCLGVTAVDPERKNMSAAHGALHLARAQRAAGHRHRLRARAARGGHPVHLREIRPRARGARRHGHQLPPAQRAARSRPRRSGSIPQQAARLAGAHAMVGQPDGAAHARARAGFDLDEPPVRARPRAGQRADRLSAASVAARRRLRDLAKACSRSWCPSRTPRWRIARSCSGTRTISTTWACSRWTCWASACCRRCAAPSRW